MEKKKQSTIATDKMSKHYFMWRIDVNLKIYQRTVLWFNILYEPQLKPQFFFQFYLKWIETDLNNWNKFQPCFSYESIFPRYCNTNAFKTMSMTAIIPILWELLHLIWQTKNGKIFIRLSYATRLQLMENKTCRNSCTYWQVSDDEVRMNVFFLTLVGVAFFPTWKWFRKHFFVHIMSLFWSIEGRFSFAHFSSMIFNLWFHRNFPCSTWKNNVLSFEEKYNFLNWNTFKWKLKVENSFYFKRKVAFISELSEKPFTSNENLKKKTVFFRLILSLFIRRNCECVRLKKNHTKSYLLKRSEKNHSKSQDLCGKSSKRIQIKSWRFIWGHDFFPSLLFTQH